MPKGLEHSVRRLAQRVPEGVQHFERGLSALALVPEGLQHRVGVERWQRGIGGP